MDNFPHVDSLYAELCELANLGPRFHGGSGEKAAAEFIHKRLSSAGPPPIHAHTVSTPSWYPAGESYLEVTSPHQWNVECWPLLWTAGTGERPIEGALYAQGKQGLWDNSFVWTKFCVLADDRVIGYISARNDGPAAPQPLPSGSALNVPHLAIGRNDGEQLSEWIEDGTDVTVRVYVPVDHGLEAVGDNLELLIPGFDSSDGEIVICAHYDTFWNTIGAYDNGSGTVALLELVRRWTSRPPRRTVRVVFFAAEEWHLAGSRAFVSALSHVQRSNIDLVLNIDGLGRSDHLECSIGPESFEQELTSQIRRFSTDRPGLKLSSRFPPLMGTDHAPFYAAGIPSAHFTFNDWSLLHRPEDTPKRDSAQNIAWTVGLIDHLVDTLKPPERAPHYDIL